MVCNKCNRRLENCACPPMVSGADELRGQKRLVERISLSATRGSTDPLDYRHKEVTFRLTIDGSEGLKIGAAAIAEPGNTMFIDFDRLTEKMVEIMRHSLVKHGFITDDGEFN